MIKFQQSISIVVLYVFISCTSSPNISTQSKNNTVGESSINKISILTYSEDGLSATITIPKGLNSIEQTLHQLLKKDNSQVIDQYLDGVIDKSIASEMKEAIINSLPEGALEFRINNFSSKPTSNILYLELDKNQIEETVFNIFKKYSSSESIPILPLFSVSTNPPTLNELKNVTLLIPCLDTKVPDQQLLLPNAPRAYRNGTHRGIDFYVNWGSSVRAVADGVIIRADHNYQEMSADFRLDLLNDTKILGRTPSDVFEHLLLGQAIYIDHGFDLVSGYRAVTIYAHLSHIRSDMQIGTIVRRGQEIGKSGNSGTKDSTLKKKTGAHLHWEMILQNKDGEYYLGQGEEHDFLYPFLKNLFVNK